MARGKVGREWGFTLSCVLEIENEGTVSLLRLKFLS